MKKSKIVDFWLFVSILKLPKSNSYGIPYSPGKLG